MEVMAPQARTFTLWMHKSVAAEAWVRVLGYRTTVVNSRGCGTTGDVRVSASVMLCTWLQVRKAQK